nr:MAG TPA: hypothetical protein [Caudoviricetes sp.]
MPFAYFIVALFWASVLAILHLAFSFDYSILWHKRTYIILHKKHHKRTFIFIKYYILILTYVYIIITSSERDKQSTQKRR